MCFDDAGFKNTRRGNQLEAQTRPWHRWIECTSCWSERLKCPLINYWGECRQISSRCIYPATRPNRVNVNFPLRGAITAVSRRGFYLWPLPKCFTSERRENIQVFWNSWTCVPFCFLICTPPPPSPSFSRSTAAISANHVREKWM